MELILDRVTKQFRNKIAVDRISLRLHPGVYGLLGANGAGKTTLLRLICGILRCDSGTVSLDGLDVSTEEYRAGLGYLPQDFGYYPEFTGMDFLVYMATLKGLARSQAGRRAAELLELVSLGDMGRKKIKTYSGGMKQRLGIAQAMLNDPRILILDEPTTGLDPKERVRFRNLISAFSKGRIVILSTHIVSDVESIAERILVMKSGRIVHCGRPGEITSEIRGQVWECAIPVEQADRYVAQLNVSNLRNERDGRTVLRVIARDKPMPNAKLAEPNLEDLYLYYFREQDTGGGQRRGSGPLAAASGAVPGRRASRDNGAAAAEGLSGEASGCGRDGEWKGGDIR